MSTAHTAIRLCAALSVTITVSAAVHYVDLNSTNAVAPFTEWATAATNIQDALDASSPGDEVQVARGVYRTGGRLVDRVLATNRVALSNR